MVDNNTSLHPLTRWRLAQTPPLTAAEVANKCDVHPTYISMLERGQRERLGADASLRLAELTGIDLLTLMTWRWTAAGKKAARKVLTQKGNEFRARAAAKRRKAPAAP